MPYSVSKDTSACSDAKPFAVKKAGGGVVAGGCHKTRGDALRHLKALYVNVPDARARLAIDVEIAAEDRRERAAAQD